MEEEDFGASEFSPHDHLTTLVAATAPTAVEGSIYSKKQPQAGPNFENSIIATTNLNSDLVYDFSSCK